MIVDKCKCNNVFIVCGLFADEFKAAYLFIFFEKTRDLLVSACAYIYENFF